MSAKNDVAVPPYLLNSGVDATEAEALPQINSRIDSAEPATVLAASRTIGKRDNRLSLALGGVILFALGGIVGNGMAHRSDNPVLATVNGVPIDRQQYEHRCETSIVKDVAVGPQVLRQMVTEELALQYAAKQGVTPPETAVEARYQEAAKSANFNANLKKALQTPDDVKHGLKTSLAQSAVITKGISVSDEEIRSFYKANTDPNNNNARYYRPDAVQIAAIISDKEADINTALHELSIGAAFTEVVRKYSKDNSRANGGVLPPIRRDRMNLQKFPGLANHLFSLKPNQQIDKIKVGSMFWLIRCIGRSEQSTVPFEQVQQECREGALLVRGANNQGQAVQKDYQDFVKNADIKALQAKYHDAVTVNGK